MTATKQHKPLTLWDGITIGALAILTIMFLAWRLG